MRIKINHYKEFINIEIDFINDYIYINDLWPDGRVFNSWHHSPFSVYMFDQHYFYNDSKEENENKD